MSRLDKLFKDQLSKYEEIPTPQAWDQIHGQLAANKRKKWGRRLAIAASILLFATIGYVGYMSLDSLAIKKDQLVVKAMDDKANNVEQPTSKPEEVILEINNADEKEFIVKSDEEGIAEVESVEKIAKKPLPGESPIKRIEVKMPVMARVELDKPEIEQKIIIQEPKEVIEEPILPEPIEEVLLAKNKTMDEAEKGLEIKGNKKTYAQVKIIYKANENSELTSSGKNTLINKGIDKLTKFSNEHLLTADRKTKLRNTTEDLLELNIGKLLNKSNKEGI